VRVIFIFSFMVLAVLFQGCATKEVKVEQGVVVFPPPPSEPRVLYLETYRGKKDSTSKLSPLDIFLGETIESKSLDPVIIKPYGVTLDNDTAYVVDTAARFVYAINLKTKDVIYIGRSGAGTLSGPVDVAIDSAGLIYVSDMRQKKIYVFNKKGKFQSAIGGRLDFTHPTGIAIDKKLNRLYVADTKAHRFKAFDLKTKKLIFEVGKRGKGDGEFNFLTNIAVDRRNHNIVVTDTQNFRIQIFDKDGKFIRKFGKVGDRPGDFARPKGVAVDSEGHIYVTDSAFNNIQIFRDDGKLMLYFGHAGYTEPGTFRLITGIYIDENDKMLIADGFTGRAQTFQYLSKKWKLEHPKEYKELKEFKPKTDTKIEAEKK